jgi:hypothetical protein
MAISTLYPFSVSKTYTHTSNDNPSTVIARSEATKQSRFYSLQGDCHARLQRARNDREKIATPPFERLGMAKAARSPLLPRLVALFQVEQNNCVTKEKNINFKVEVK